MELEYLTLIEKPQTEEFSVYNYTKSYGEFFECLFKLNTQDIKIKTSLTSLHGHTNFNELFFGKDWNYKKRCR